MPRKQFVSKSQDAKSAPMPKARSQSALSTPSSSQHLSRKPSGLPSELQAGMEGMSGVSLADVRVHHNSDRPEQIGADAYTQGSDIFLGPGQDGFLAHEAWHAVQQKQGRVRPSLQVGGLSGNIDSQLESEADAMGKKASSLGARLPSAEQSAKSNQLVGQSPPQSASAPIQAAGCGSGSRRRAVDNERALSRRWPEVLQSSAIEQILGNQARPTTETEEEKTQRRTQEMNDPSTEAFRYGSPFYRQGEETIGFDVSHEFHKVYTVNQALSQVTFYSATRLTTADIIGTTGTGVGFDPSKGGSTDPISASQWNSRGYTYFSYDPAVCISYMRSLGVSADSDGDAYVIFEFTLPLQTKFVVDPEIPGGLRTKNRIPASSITNHTVYTSKHRPSKNPKRSGLISA